MQAKVELPKTPSVRDEHESVVPIQHLMSRLNPRLLVKEGGDRSRRRMEAAPCIGGLFI